uniref:Uncharacterized protein n=1 Tax=Panagrolaimus sp. JU765 TaxID=591449 RepID=A0AC34Q3R4_9BILA
MLPVRSVLSRRYGYTNNTYVNPNYELLVVKSNVFDEGGNDLKNEKKWFIEIISYKPAGLHRLKNSRILKNVVAGVVREELVPFFYLDLLKETLKRELFEKCTPATRFNVYRASKRLVPYTSLSSKQFCFKVGMDDNVLFVVLMNLPVPLRERDWMADLYRRFRLCEYSEICRHSCKGNLIEAVLPWFDWTKMYSPPLDHYPKGFILDE